MVMVNFITEEDSYRSYKRYSRHYIPTGNIVLKSLKIKIEYLLRNSIEGKCRYYRSPLRNFEIMSYNIANLDYFGSRVNSRYNNLPEDYSVLSENDYILKNEEVFQYPVNPVGQYQDETLFKLPGIRDIIVTRLYDMLDIESLNNICKVSSLWRKIRNSRYDISQRASLNDEIYILFKFID